MSDGDRPNILVIWGDDIGITNLSCYSDGLMGYRTHNIDRIADEGMRFTDSYGDLSCTAGPTMTGSSTTTTSRLAATAVMTQFLATFKDFPPRQKAASFTIDQVVAKLENALTEGR